MNHNTKQAPVCVRIRTGRKVKEYEHQIDQMVYELYDLTKEENATVEQFGTKDE